MAHIIAFMDEVLHEGPHSIAVMSGAGKVRRRHARPLHSAVGLHGEPDARGVAGIGTEEVRMDRVNALRAAIADGSYKVSAAELADRILHSMLQK